MEGIQYRRLDPTIPETYLCKWEDRHKLELALLAQGKGMTIREHPGCQLAKDFTRRPHVQITVDSYAN